MKLDHELPKRRFLDQNENLPQTFNTKNVKRNPSKACMLCENEFTTAIGANPIRHCKRCGRSICDVCSLTKRQLSKSDKEQHRVCDKCDTEMDNFRLQQNHRDVLNAQMEKIEVLNATIETLDNEKQQLLESFEEERKGLEEKI